jgi:exosortase family protein XrtF
VLRNPFYRFLIVGTTLFLAWYFVYEWYLRDHSMADEWVIHHLTVSSELILKGMGYELTDYGFTGLHNRVGIANAPGVMIGAACDGLVLFALFAVFVIAYPGSSRHRWWFIPTGILLIHYLNALRVVALTIIISWKKEWLSFNHDYTFTILVYSIVFGLWWIWVKKFPAEKTIVPETK